MSEYLGNYEIIKKIATGGMAELLLAKQRGVAGFERTVCLKRILPHLAEQEDFVRMFQDEARVAAHLVHPNIAQIYDIAEADGSYFIAMEYVKGEDLRRVYNKEVGRGRAMPQHIAAQVALGTASGLDYAHHQTGMDGKPLGIVHRDISPQNIIVTYTGHAKVVDFGVAKSAAKTVQTRTGVLKGKYSYMSPEQASGDPVDARTDIFALGVTLYEVSTGVRLFKRDSELETLRAVIDCQVRPPTDIIPDYDPALEAIVLRMLAKSADERYQSAGQVVGDLEGYLLGAGQQLNAATLSEYMHDLFADKLADEILFQGQEPWDESMTPSGKGKKGKKKAKADSDAQAPLASDPTSEGTGAFVRETEVGEAPAGGEPSAHTSVEDAKAAMEAAEAAKAAAEARAKRDGQWEDEQDWGASEGAPSQNTQFHYRTDDRTSIMDPSELAPPEKNDGPPTAATRVVDVAEVMKAQEAAEDKAQDAAATAAAAAQQTAKRRLMAVVGLLVIAVGGWFYEKHQAGDQSDAVTAVDTGVLEDAAGGGGADDADGSEANGKSGKTVTARTAPLPGETARLSVRSNLALMVWEGERLLGQTPFQAAPIKPGRHRLKFTNTAEGVTFYRDLQLADKERRNEDVQAKQTSLLVTGSPWAWVKVGERVPTETPEQLDVYEGEYTVLFECPGGTRKTVQVFPAFGQDNQAHVACGPGE